MVAAFTVPSLSPPQHSLRIRQRGQGAVEFLFAAVPVLLIGLSSIEAIHWYFARQAVSLALSQAARAAITQHADPVTLDDAFAQALLPIYAGPSAEASRIRLRNTMNKRERETGLPAWNIHIISPSAATFSDFASQSPDLPRSGKPVIDNDYLIEQHLARSEPYGSLSGQNTLEANTLILRLTWLHEPLLPGVKQLLKQIAPADSGYGSLAMARAGYLPLRRQVALMMQSHPVAWDMPAHGRISRAMHSRHADPGHKPAQPHNTDIQGPPLSLAPPGTGRPQDSGKPHDNASSPDMDALPPCAGLWCLRDDVNEDATDYQDETGREGGSGSQDPGGTAPPQDNAYRGDDADAPATEPDDCPGCCD